MFKLQAHIFVVKDFEISNLLKDYFLIVELYDHLFQP
jgi:hypothetical protein